MNRAVADASWSTARRPKRPFPRRTLRRLLELAHISPGNRVLDAGCVDAGFVAYLRYLGVGTRAYHPSADVIDRMKRRYPDVEFIGGFPVEALSTPGNGFDVVVTRMAADDRESLLSHEALKRTANLLAALAPGGRLLMIADRSGRGGHSPGCVKQHLQNFCQRVQVHPLPATTLLGRLGWAGSSGIREHFVSVLKPARKLEAAAWLQRVPGIDDEERSPCCD